MMFYQVYKLEKMSRREKRRDRRAGGAIKDEGEKQ